MYMIFVSYIKEKYVMDAQIVFGILLIMDDFV